MANNTEERGKALIYANPFTLTGGEFYSSFDRLTHVKKLNTILRKLFIFHLTRTPYLITPLQSGRFKGDNNVWHMNCVDEIALVNPRNSTEEVCEEFAMRYPSHKAGLYYYGDASGKARSTMNRDFKHHYEIVEFNLRKYLVNGSDRTMRANPSVVKRRDFVNPIFEDKHPIKITINETCKYLIGDLMYLKQALDGTKDKHIVTDKESGEKYQKYGHLSDGMDYILVELFKEYYNG